MQNTERHLWNDFIRLLKDYWFELAMFLLFVTVVFYIGIAIF